MTRSPSGKLPCTFVQRSSSPTHAAIALGLLQDKQAIEPLLDALGVETEGTLSEGIQVTANTDEDGQIQVAAAESEGNEPLFDLEGEGTLIYSSFVETVISIRPMYYMRLIGGPDYLLLFLQAKNRQPGMNGRAR